MKAIVYDGIQNINVKKVANPKIEVTADIIVKITSIAIYGSDLHLIT